MTITYIYIYVWSHWFTNQLKPYVPNKARFFFQAGSVSGLNPTPWGAALDGLAKFRPVLPRCDGDCCDQMVMGGINGLHLATIAGV